MNETPHRSAPRHGGDLDLATARYGAPRDGWLDLSTGINPHAYPVAGIDPALLRRLPGNGALRTLLDIARTAYGLPAAVAIAASPGTEAAIRLLPFVAPTGSVAIVSPTYGTHADAWHNAGRTIVLVPDVDSLPHDTAVVVIGSPNNPDGRVTPPTALIDLARRLARRSGLLIIDEAFADVSPGISLAPALADLSAVVLRSFGKFYGLPGLRLGFVAGATRVVERIAALIGDWPVSTHAIAIGTAALADTGWQSTMRRQLADEAGRLRALLSRHDLSVLGTTDLFVLIETADGAELHAHLVRQGIWTRAFDDRPSWLRLGLPPDEDGFARLDRALSAR